MRAMMTISSNMSAARTIAAISTPPGKGGVAVIRISGADALATAKKIFLPRGGRGIEMRPPRTQIYGDILYIGEPVDDGMLTYFPAPNSYTGEDTVEISCHGGVLITRTVLESAFHAGAFPAERGEFTRRAFVNGKLSLSETEAIGMLLDAESEAQIRLTRGKSRTRLTEEVEAMRGDITSLLSSIWARIDYPEEDLGELSREAVLCETERIMDRLKRLIGTYRTGRAVTEGIKTVICGKPNVGKSTLYNLLLGEDAAIVTDIPGTTRDVLERSVSLGDVMLRLYDTAGIRAEASDAVEEIGIARSREKLAEAELILALFDTGSGILDADIEITEQIMRMSAPKIAIITKCDNVDKDREELKDKLRCMGFSDIMEISAKSRGSDALTQLAEGINKLFTDESIVIGDDAIISSARQHAALLRAEEHLSCAATAYRIGLAEDAASSDIELALGAISELDGRAVTEEVVADIFAKFCVGK